MQAHRHHRSVSRSITLLTLLGLIISVQTASAKEKKPLLQPDYTKGEQIQDKRRHDHSLGPIGVRANIWKGEQLTRDTRQLQIREVFPDTPAEGKLKPGDVILGVYSPAGTQDGLFNSDARKALAAAITAAEQKENGGKLVLNVWRPDRARVVNASNGQPGEYVTLEVGKTGKTMQVTIMLPVRGTFSATAPWDCEKTQNLIDAACQSVLDDLYEKEGKRAGQVKGGIPNLLGVLGLLATGEDQYMPTIQKYVRAVCPPEEKLDWSGMHTWGRAYQLLLVTEYYYATKDEYVKPYMTELATKLAMGASGVGTYSHSTTIREENDGRMYGTPAAYGAMNQVSITCIMGFVLAQKCGIRNEAIDDTVKRGLAFMRWFVDKGMIPYGDHDPWHRWRTARPEHDNNGKGSQCAVLFNLVGDKEAATYFTRMTLASYHDRENGHTGHFFGRIWGAPGAFVGGPKAAQRFIGNCRWFFELERRADGGSVFQPPLMFRSKTWGWSTTGARLIMHCLPRKKLLITGKEGNCIEPIIGTELRDIVAMANYDATKRSTPELLKDLGSWSPEVRIAAALELGNRDDNVVKELIAMLKSPNRYARYGACYALKTAGRGSVEAVDALVALITDSPDVSLRFWAINALSKCKGDNGLAQNDVLMRAVPVLLKQAATVEPDDPGCKLHLPISNSLFSPNKEGGIFKDGKGLENVDRKLLIPAIRQLLQNPNAYARGPAADICKYLNKEDLEQVWKDIYYCAKYRAPSGAMAQNGPRAGCLEAMAKHNVEEAIEVAIKMVCRQKGWGDKGRKFKVWPILPLFGAALKPYFAELEKQIAEWEAAESDKLTKAVKQQRKWLEQIKKAKPHPMISIKKYIKDDPGPVIVR